MSSIRAAHIGLAMFFAVLAISGSVLVTHTLSPSIAEPLAIDDEVPAFALPDSSGQIRQIDTPRNFYRVLVYVPGGRLTADQQRGLGNLVSSIAQSLPVEVLAITNDAAPGTAVEDVCPFASTLLVDTARTTWQITGRDANEASVCVIGRLNQLRFRSKLPPDGPVQMASAQQSANPAAKPVITALAQVFGHQ